MWKKLVAEFIGTAWLVFGGCGSAIFAAAYPDLGIGFVGVSMAFGLTLLTMAYAIGDISGCHINPAVSLGLALGGRFDKKLVIPYMVSQTLGGIFGAWLIYIIAAGAPGFTLANGFASNGYGVHSPGGYGFLPALVIELVITAGFIFIIMGATKKDSVKGFAPIPIGLCLTLVHLISIPVTNCSVNPARSTATAVIAGGWALSQLWFFWLWPLVGGAIGGIVYKNLNNE